MFEEFEGFKRIKNTKNLSIEKIYSILFDYQSEMGKLEYDMSFGDKKIIINFKGKYDAEIRLSGNDIIIERILEEGRVEDREPSVENGKKIKMAQADRMIDQIFDLINDYIDDEIIKEHITSSKQTLRMRLREKVPFLGISIVRYGEKFEITDSNENYLYEVADKKFNKTYSIKSLKSNMEVASVNYSKIKEDKFTIIEKPFQITELKRDTSTEKIRFITTGTGQKLKITGDYTDNHFIVELNEVVIGAVDSLDPMVRSDYRIEINNLEKINLVIAIAILLDVYAKKEK